MNFFALKWFNLYLKSFCYFGEVNTHYLRLWYIQTKVILPQKQQKPSQLDFSYPDVFIAWQQFAPKSGNLKWINNSWKSRSQGYGKSRMATWPFLAPWQTSSLFDGLKPFMVAVLMPSQWVLKKKKKYIYIYMLHWTKKKLSSSFVN